MYLVKISTIIALTILAAQQVSADFTYKTCPDPNNVTNCIKIHSISISPDPIQSGKSLQMEMNGTLCQDLDQNAYVTGTAKYLFLTVPINNQDMCDYVECPMQKGQHVVQKSVDIPDTYPKGTYKVHLEGYNGDNSPLFCVDASIQLD